MLERDSYWARFMQRRVSRRRALQGAALGAAGTAAYLAVGCGDDGRAEGGALERPPTRDPALHEPGPVAVSF